MKAQHYNPRVRIIKEELLSDNWYTLKKITFKYEKKMDNGRHNPVKCMTEATERPFYSIIDTNKPSYLRDNSECLLI